ncbi:MAG TPA: hypothetical protein VFV72_11500 [Candidatus Limnocylindrales bacterium]|nr:hypothetical protein [Candidatus Limnocylindrales bacterium]
MPLFGRKTHDETSQPGDGAVAAAEELGQRIETAVTDAAGRIRVEDLLSAAGAVCGEACIAAAGEFDPESHDFAPGAAVLSDRVNEILCGNAGEWPKTGRSVFGVVFAEAIRAGYVIEDFPVLADVFRVYLAGLGGNGDRWGYVSLSVPADNWPRTPPLRAAYEMRREVRAILAEHAVTTASWPTACSLMVARELGRVQAAIDRPIGVRIAIETINGMAKMAPMTERHVRELARGTGSGASPLSSAIDGDSPLGQAGRPPRRGQRSRVAGRDP